MMTPSSLASFSVLIKLVVGDAKRAFVGEEHFEAADPRLTISRKSFSASASNRVTPMWNVKSQALFPCALPSQVQKPPSACRPAGTNHFDECRRAAHERRLARGLMGVLGKRPHERQINVDVRIDEARENKFSRRIDDSAPGGAKFASMRVIVSFSQ